MKLVSLTIKNFRSIEDETFTIIKGDGAHTFTLIGINESGKSSFLKAVSLVDNDDEKVIFPQDYFEETQPISIVLNYELETQEEKDLKSALAEKGFEKDILSKIKVEKVAVCATFESATNAPKKVFDKITFQQKVFDDYTLLGDKPAKKDPQQTQEDFDIEKYFEARLPKYFWEIAHRIVF
ncbi:MAG: AAA family ATPase, partial [Thermodesulfobacteriota bacterium]